MPKVCSVHYGSLGIWRRHRLEESSSTIIIIIRFRMCVYMCPRKWDSIFVICDIATPIIYYIRTKCGAAFVVVARFLRKYVLSLVHAESISRRCAKCYLSMVVVVNILLIGYVMKCASAGLGVFRECTRAAGMTRSDTGDIDMTSGDGLISYFCKPVWNARVVGAIDMS